MADQCSYVIRPPKTHKGRIYVRAPRRCSRRATVHGRCWQHHDYYCDQCCGTICAYCGAGCGSHDHQGDGQWLCVDCGSEWVD